MPRKCNGEEIIICYRVVIMLKVGNRQSDHLSIVARIQILAFKDHRDSPVEVHKV